MNTVGYVPSYWAYIIYFFLPAEFKSYHKMAIFYDEIPDKHLEWIATQKMFWVATAALNGHVNLSPKGCIESFHIVDNNRVWYEDMTGSGVETIAHMREPGNARITVMFHAFEGAPWILRMWGTGTVHEFGTPEYDALIPPVNCKAGSHAAIVIDVHKVATLERFCDSLEKVEAHVSPAEKAPNGIKAWWTTENTCSLDGLPALEQAHNTPLSVKNSYDCNTARPLIQVDPVASAALLMVKFLDGKLLLAFLLGVATTLGALRLTSMRAH